VSAKLWLVFHDEHAYYADVIGANSAINAAKIYTATIKKNQLQDIAYAIKNAYTPDALDLPKEIYCVPMFAADEYHDVQISSDRKYKAQAFTELFDWSKKETVKL
jgi:hypothetical protein